MFSLVSERCTLGVLARGCSQAFFCRAKQRPNMKHLKEGSLETRMARFLSKYRLTPHCITGLSLCEMLLGHRPRSHLDLRHPDLVERVQSNKLKQMSRHDHCISVSSFKGDTVYVPVKYGLTFDRPLGR